VLILTTCREGDWLKVTFNGSFEMENGGGVSRIETSVWWKYEDLMSQPGIRLAARSMAGQAFAKITDTLRRAMISHLELALNATLPESLIRRVGSGTSWVVRPDMAEGKDGVIVGVSRQDA
jgi:hypothetical protein